MWIGFIRYWIAISDTLVCTVMTLLVAENTGNGLTNGSYRIFLRNEINCQLMTFVVKNKQRRTVKRKFEGRILTVLMNFLQNHSLWTGVRAALRPTDCE